MTAGLAYPVSHIVAFRSSLRASRNMSNEVRYHTMEQGYV